MRIHPRLKENVELNPTKESSQENLDLLCQKIDSRVITLPLYHRFKLDYAKKCRFVKLSIVRKITGISNINKCY